KRGEKPFFAQGLDGKRHGHVTGVQTCALPIYLQSDAGDHLEQPSGYHVRNASEPHAVKCDGLGCGQLRLYASSRNTAKRGEQQEIGRASCRERVGIQEVAVEIYREKRT